jgi:tRNA (uracil-5-)-methyltransferase
MAALLSSRSMRSFCRQITPYVARTAYSAQYRSSSSGLEALRQTADSRRKNVTAPLYPSFGLDALQRAVALRRRTVSLPKTVPLPKRVHSQKKTLTFKGKGAVLPSQSYQMSMASNAENITQSPKKRRVEHDNGSKGSIQKKFKKAKKMKDDDWPEGSHEEILTKEVEELLKGLKVSEAERKLPELQSHFDIKIMRQSSSGDGLGVHAESGTVFVVPFTVTGDLVSAKPFKYFKDSSYFLADHISTLEPSKERNNDLIKCQYFGQCGGCQFQMLPYENQLEFKKQVVAKAYEYFSGLDPKLIPAIEATLESPRQFEYRTKLTPHFDGPPGSKRSRRNQEGPHFKEVPPIGFMLKGTRKTIDIEDCPIGTDVLRQTIKTEKQRVADKIHTYKNGATLLLRESTERVKTSKFTTDMVKPGQLVEEHEHFKDIKSCVTDFKGISKEYVGKHIFINPAGSFFQNNNSILEPFISYIRSILTPSDSSPLSYLVDAYCGSGLFTITLSDMFRKSIGIDISDASINYARKNANLNNLPKDQATFLSADAANIFDKIDFSADETVVIIDPPRKGCDKNFLSQLLRFGPQKIVYVSCNVHTQARDVGVMVNGMEGVGEGKYVLEKLRGMDFFPQSHHVEGVAILTRKEGL